MKKQNFFFISVLQWLSFKWFQKRKWNRLKNIYLFILFIYIFYLKFKSLLLFFLYFINRCVCTRSSLKEKFKLKGGILYIHVYTLARRCRNFKLEGYILYIHIDRWQRFNGALWWQIYDVSWMNSSTKATRALKKIKRKSQFRGKLGRSNLKHSLPKVFFF